MVRTRTRAALPAATIRRVASMPSTTGMRTSMRITSGTHSTASSTALAAVFRLADDVDVGACLEDQPEPVSHECLIVGDQDANAHRSLPSGISAVTT